ncbi:ABC transporter ATP-binding protein [Hydrotalea sandarakina]|jgi:lipopolysaccharide transport system ATP-binding protein|uniref:Lipopolysaccharide transport system ATP-binding protein n=1 Tax=Hydrotalea sandarakina TaxID=1004304 RepID=A0A2W7RPI7_9BACT|nr:polysaccharide ABC transporter ATP-binding protein [Hydrotalea sandarakina]PZX62274.1 lipopolysaccharide transport system ATP-binding protein [Hydrotalea sandarakina]
MSQPIIQVEHLSKQYRLGEVGTGTLSHDLKRWWYKVRGKEDPFARIGEVNDRSTKGDSEYVWALKDINFSVQPGEVVGIIGRNGAGKSTLLKILSKTTAPTTGRIKVRGRIASLLEVGTGFHPELTGRENIYLNGAILGMTRKEINRQFDAIVDFAGVERYVDTPVKRYSSGMYVRLAFAVAAHLEPEILIVDEVLAVGDAEFQKKCLGKMKDVSVQDGRTVLFVSHNMGAVKQLCTSAIALENGLITYVGNTIDTVSYYQNRGEKKTYLNYIGLVEKAPGNAFIKLLKFEVGSKDGKVITISSGIDFNIVFINVKVNINLAVSLIVQNSDEIIICEIPYLITTERNSKHGIYEINFNIPGYTLNAGTYSISILFGEDQRFVLKKFEHVVEFEIVNEYIGNNINNLPGFLRINPFITCEFKDL